MLISIQLAIKNVYRKKERSLLTIIGVLLAVGSFISLLSIAEGLYERINREINGRKVDIYILPKDAAALPTGPIGTVGFSSGTLPLSIVKKLKKTSQFPHIKHVCPIYRVQQKIGNQTIIAWGIKMENFAEFFPYFKIKSGGRFFEDNASEAIMGGNLAMERDVKLESLIPIEGQPFTVVGIGVPHYSFQDYFCYIPFEKAMKLKNAKGAHEIWIQVNRPIKSEISDTAKAIRKAFPDANVKTKEEYLGAANEYVNYAWLLQFAISAIGILIAITAAMNTMLMSTYERIKEFGTLRAIGTTRFNVFFMILTESLILCFIGGLGGVVLGIMGSQLLDDTVQVLLQLSFPLAKITFNLIMYAFILSIVVGLIAAIIPAVIVYRMQIIDALRWE
ncbi:MAG: ABC transporter permease [Candidatus Eremiobacteraeota bacterium]|nr:ABC transporter permease [Candidatus Eremiobacteraeota bacterium]